LRILCFWTKKRRGNKITSWKDQFCRFVALDLAQVVGEGRYETNLPEIYGTAGWLAGWLAQM
jgi:hypothetical protein